MPTKEPASPSVECTLDDVRADGSLNSRSKSNNDEIDLLEVWNVLWEGRWLVVAFTVISSLISIFYALSLPNIYRSDALLVPSEDSQGGGMSRMAGQLGGLASLAGIDIGGARSIDKVDVAIEVLKSRQFITSFVKQHNILPEVLAVEKWNRSTNQLSYDSELYDAANKKWVREVKPPKTIEPSDWEAFEAFAKIINVSQNKETRFVTVSITHQSPYLAKSWVTLLIDDVNEVIKEQDVSQARRSIEFLQSQLSRVAVADMRTVFYQLIEEQTKTIMLAEVREQYAFSTIDPPVVAETKVAPKRVTVFIFGSMLGALISVIILFMRYIIVGQRQRVD